MIAAGKGKRSAEAADQATAIPSKRKQLFTERDLAPATGSPFEEFRSELFVEVGKKTATYDSLYVPNPLHNRFIASLEQLRQMSIATPGQRKWALRNLAASGSGKTTGFFAYQRWLESTGKVKSREQPAVIVGLHRACSTRSLWASVLDHYGDAFVNPRDTEEVLRKRAYACFEKFGTHLFAIDEVQHLAFRSTAQNDVTDTIKRVLDDGVVSIALLGTDAARSMLNGNAQLSNRMLPPSDFMPLNPRLPADVADFAGFMGRLDTKIIEAELTKSTSRLDSRRTTACLMQITGGILGRSVNLVRVALGIAIRRGADHIELCDLSQATTQWAIPQRLTTYNPFVHGVRAIK